MLTTGDIWGLALGGGGALLCFVLGGVLLSGRGADLIVGYGAMTPEERKKYNGKRIGQAVGVYLMLLGVAVGVILWAGYTGREGLAVALAGTLLVSIVPFAVYLWIGKRFRS